MGTVELVTKRAGTRSVLHRLYQAGSSKCLFPRTHRDDLEAVLLNTAGGITGGDRIRVSARAEAGSHLTLTTQACERAYRAQKGEVGQLRNDLHITAGSRINWLPQETILYDGSALDRRLSIDVEPTAQLLMVEPLIFGRAAMGERLSQAQFSDRIDIWRAGRRIYVDAMRLDGDVSAHLARPFVANGAGALASLVYIAGDAAAWLTQLRAILPESAGASLLGDDILVARVLAADGFALRQSLLPILRLLNHDHIPRSWTI